MERGPITVQVVGGRDSTPPRGRRAMPCGVTLSRPPTACARPRPSCLPPGAGVGSDELLLSRACLLAQCHFRSRSFSPPSTRSPATGVYPHASCSRSRRVLAGTLGALDLSPPPLSRFRPDLQITCPSQTRLSRLLPAAPRSATPVRPRAVPCSVPRAVPQRNSRSTIEATMSSI